MIGPKRGLEAVEPERPAPTKRDVLAVASSGGHFKQLVSLVTRLPELGSVTWLTYDVGSRELLASTGRSADRVVYTSYAAPRDVKNLARNAGAAWRLLREQPFDLAISTGAGIAVATLPSARAAGIRAVYIESATRTQGPSVSGRILERTPGVELYTQNAGYGRRWKQAGSVHDAFEQGPTSVLRSLRRAVVTIGTIRPYGFERLLRRLLAVLPSDVEVLWQTGATDTSRLPIDARPQVTAAELEEAMHDCDLVIAHAGTGSALTAFEAGKCPLLVPRRQRYNEHIDDHQVVTARDLAARGLAVYSEVEDVDLDLLQHVASRSVVKRTTLPALEL